MNLTNAENGTMQALNLKKLQLKQLSMAITYHNEVRTCSK
jgi:hypothetical protein